jgi:hypothetical protein
MEINTSASRLDIEAMRTDTRMVAYFPRIIEMATFESILGQVVLDSEPSRG